MNQCTGVTYRGLHQTTVRWLPQQGYQFGSRTRRIYQSSRFSLNYSDVICVLQLVVESGSSKIIFEVEPHPQPVYMLLVLHVFDDDEHEVPAWRVDVSLSDDENNTSVPFDFEEDLAVLNFDSITVVCTIFEKHGNGVYTLTFEGNGGFEEIENTRGL